MSLISPIKLSTSERCVFLAISISLNREIMSFYSYYAKKGLIYIIITDSSSRQPFFYAKYTKLNTYMLYNICLVSLNKYIFLCYARCYTY